MPDYQSFLLLALVMVLGLILYRRISSTGADPQPGDCAGGSVFIHPSSSQAGMILEAALQKDRGTGISSAVVVDGKLIYADAIGQADRKSKLGANALMRTGSIAKLFTAVAAARLVEMNLLDLHSPIAAIVPEFAHGGITPFQLGTHFSGIRQYNFQKLSEANNRKLFRSQADAIELFASDPLLSNPGEAFHYSSFGYNLLGLVVERVYGSPFAKALHDLVTEPLGVFSLKLDDTAAEIPCRPVFYTMAFGRLRIQAPLRNNSDLYPSGGQLVTAGDLAVFGDTVFNGENLQPDTIRLFTNPGTTPAGDPGGYSFGWQLGRAEDGRIEWYGHGGQINGAYASVRYYPASKLTIAGMSNYNLWLTSSPPEFFHAVRRDLPAIFSKT